MKCNNCGSVDIDIDPESSQKFCNECGSLVSGPTFDKGARFVEDGAQTELAGRMLSALPNKEQTVIASGQGVRIFQSGAGTVNSAYQVAVKIGNRMGVTTATLNTTKNLITSLYETSNRPQMFVTHLGAISLFICSLKEGLPHLLIDYSSFLNIPIHKLAKSLAYFHRYYGFKLPDVSNESLINRFMDNVSDTDLCLLEDNRGNIIELSLKLLHVAKLEGLDLGRVHSGLLAACFQLACAYFNIHLDVNKASVLGYVSPVTLMKRLDELSLTEISKVDLSWIINKCDEEITEFYTDKVVYLNKSIRNEKEGLENVIDIDSRTDYEIDSDEEAEGYLDDEDIIKEKNEEWERVFENWSKKQDKLERRERNEKIKDDLNESLNVILNRNQIESIEDTAAVMNNETKKKSKEIDPKVVGEFLDELDFLV